MKKYRKLAEIYTKNLDNPEFLVYQLSNHGHVTEPPELIVLKIALKVVSENVYNTYKKSHSLLLPFFSHNFSFDYPPDAINREVFTFTPKRF